MTSPFVAGQSVLVPGAPNGPLAGLTVAAKDHFDVAGQPTTVNLEFKVRGQDAIGRQSQTWVRFPGRGWKVVSAHVSAMSAPPS